MLESKSLGINSPESALVLSDLYDKHFNIHNSEAGNLIGSVLYSEKENPYLCTHYDRTLKDYIKCGIQKIFSMSLKEYQNLPVWEMEMINKVGIERLEELSRNINKINDDMENTVGELDV